MQERDKGYITVALSLFLGVLLIFVLFVLEWIYIYAGIAKAEVAITANSKGLFGNYHGTLFRDYHLLMIDKTMGTESEATLEAALQSQLSYSLAKEKQAFSYTIEDVVLAGIDHVMDESLETLQSQIHSYSGYAMMDVWLEKLKNRAEGTDAQVSVTNHEQERVDSVDVDLQDPRSFFKDLTGTLLLQIVCPDGKKPDDKEVDLSRLPSYQAGHSESEENNTIDFLNGTGISALLNQNPLDTNKVLSVSEMLELAFYIQACFRNCCSETWERTTVLTNEQEYILHGGNSDRKNLVATIKDIIMLRFPFNYACLKKDVVKQGLITTAATVLAMTGKTSISFMSMILNGAICYGEGMLDVRALLNGELVPLVKHAKDWRLGILSFLKQSIQENVTKECQNGLSYQDYLSILMLLKSDKTQIYYRILDVITLNIRQEEERFSFANMMTGATLQYRVSLKPKFSAILHAKDSNLYTIYETRALKY